MDATAKVAIIKAVEQQLKELDEDELTAVALITGFTLRDLRDLGGLG